MKCKDGRFAKDPRFLFFALNSFIRWETINTLGVSLQRDSAFRTATVAQMRDMIVLNGALARKFMFYGGSLRGMRSYWFKRCGELLDMVKQR